MGQIVRRKKKGRPSKAYLAHRSGDSPAAAQPDLRRSLRRRNVRYNIEFDDYLDEDDEDEEEDERRREKKLKLVVKLNQDRDRDEDESAPSRTRSGARGEHSRDSSEDESEKKPLKKRRIGGGRRDNEDGEEEEEEGGDDNEEENENENEEEDENLHDNNDDDDGEVKGRKVDSKGLHPIPGTPRKSPSGIPLPDKRTLELILDKLQKKDTYGVYAEPVDPEELPDYHDVIEHPMDFATVRKKLANGSYHTLELFESDVFLICSNAMQYNSPETIYHKQARSIQELARKKFEKLRIDFETSQSELKSEQKTRLNSLVRKQAKKPLLRASQEPVGSDFSAGATLANIGDVQPTSHPVLGGSCERPCNNDGLAEGNAFLIDANQEKTEDFLSGKSLLSKLGRKPFGLDENRRATYSVSMQPISKSDSIFMTFESEIKQLVTVGLHAECSYARSLARFAATLGPVAWKIASQRIQQALPAGCKFGRGWVGEYEPLPTPVLMLDNRIQKEPGFVSKFQSATDLIKDGKNGKIPEPSMEHHVHGLMLEGKQPSSDPASGLTSEGKPSLFGSGIRPSAPVNVIYQQQNVPSRSSGKPENKGLKQVELNSLPSSNQNNASLSAKFSSDASPGVSKPREMVPRNMNTLASIPFKEPDTNGVVGGDLPNGKVINSSLNRRVTVPPSESTSNQTGRAAPFVPHGQGLDLSDPGLMRMLALKAQAQKQQTSSNHSPVDTPVTGPPSESTSSQTGRATPFVPHGKGLDLSDPVLMKMLALKAQAQRKQTSSNHSPVDTPVTGPPSESTSSQTGRASPFVPHGQGVDLSDPVLKKMLALKAQAQGQKQQTSSNHSPVDTPVTGPPSESTSNQTGRAAPFVPPGQGVDLSDPVLMKMLALKAQAQAQAQTQKQQTSSNHSPVDTPPATSSVPSGRRDDLSNAAAAAARAWMSVGAGGFRQGPDNSSSPKNQISADSLYNPSRDFHQHIPRIRGEFPSGGIPFQSEKSNFPFQALAPQPIHTGGVSQFPNRPMVFPQLAAADLSRFQMQSPWRGLSPHDQPRQKQETLPPDLNIGFQSPGSPAKQSSGVMVDSQQPDLALQL